MIAGRCTRCGAVLREDEISPRCGWGAERDASGRLVGLRCPSCRADDADLEAERRFLAEQRELDRERAS